MCEYDNDGDLTAGSGQRRSEFPDWSTHRQFGYFLKLLAAKTGDYCGLLLE